MSLARDPSKSVSAFPRKVSVTAVRFESKLKRISKFYKNSPISSPMEIGSGVLQINKRTDIAKTTGEFLQLFVGDATRIEESSISV
jgi:hypothetical protein